MAKQVRRSISPFGPLCEKREGKLEQPCLAMVKYVRKKSGTRGDSVSSQIFKTHILRSYKSQHHTGRAEGYFPSRRGAEGLPAPRSKGRLGRCQGQGSPASLRNRGREGTAAVGASAQASDGSRSLWGYWYAGWLLLCAKVLGAGWSKLTERS